MTALTHAPPAPRKLDGFLGTGLSSAALATILLLATIMFLFWGGPLWKAAPGSSHVERIAYSYALVIPAVAVALGLGRRFSWLRLASGTAVIWSAKLLITASAYSYLATGSASRYSPARTWESQPPKASTVPSKEPVVTGERGNLQGTIVWSGGRAGVAVITDALAPAANGRSIQLVIASAQYAEALYLASPRDAIEFLNRDSSLHNVRAHFHGRTVWNVPLPSGSQPRPLPASKAGVYELSCDNHPGEHATLVLTDRVAALTDREGHFALLGLPAGTRQIEVIAPGSAPRSFTADVRARESTTAQLTLESNPERKQ